MTTLKSNLLPITIAAGVQPSTDKTALATSHFTQADKIRFRFGMPQKIGGWISQVFDIGALISGYARSLYSTFLTTTLDTIIGTHSNLYTLIGSALTNITPLQTLPIAIAGSLATDYGTLANNPITTTLGSGIITVADTNAPNYLSGDIVTLSGATATGGITIGQINAAQTIHTIGASSYTVITTGTATSGAVGGGNAVVRATGRITATVTAHGLSNGNRVLFAGAATFGGVTGVQINKEWIIRNVATNTFDVMTGGTASSSASSGGGAGTTYQPQIAAGNINESFGQGYGMGKYGVGLYGVVKFSTSLLVLPRIWFMDRFGVNIVATAGNQTGVYTWAGAITTAPTLISNAPTAVNYAFVSNNILVTLGAGGIINRIFSSDIGNYTIWTSSSSNQVFDYTVNGASQLISHVPVSTANLIFTDHQTFLFNYIGLPGIWSITKLEDNVGIIGPMARVSIAGTAFWMDKNNFWMWNGGNVTPMGANDQEISTIYDYVFGNINGGQSYKIFAWYNEQFQEIWFHYPSASSNECNMVARYNVFEQTWTPDTFDRTCAEYPNLPLGYPRLISSGNVLYAHEQGTDADGAAMPWSLTTNFRTGDYIRTALRSATKTTSLITGIVPDSVQTGNITLEIIARKFPQSAVATYDNTYTITPTTELMPVTIGGRLWQYKLSGNSLGQQWIGGMWHEYVQESSPQ